MKHTGKVELPKVERTDAQIYREGISAILGLLFIPLLCYLASMLLIGIFG